jgi:hypothetical protein
MQTGPSGVLALPVQPNITKGVSRDLEVDPEFMPRGVLLKCGLECTRIPIIDDE